MADKTAPLLNNEIVESPPEGAEAPIVAAGAAATQPNPPAAGGGWGGGWGFSAFSYLTEFQKAAGEISRNAVEAAKTAANSIVEVQQTTAVGSESSDNDGPKASNGEVESEDENDKRRRASLEKLGKAGDDSFLGQGLKVIDHSVENFASGAWQALGSAIKGGSDFVHKLEESIQHGGIPAATGSVAPSILETGKNFTAKGMEVLELLGKETMDLLISETGIDVDKTSKEAEEEIGEDQLFEEVTFDRCFYIYGGPEQLEELEAFSSHYALLFNRRKAKLSSDQRSLYDGKLKQVQQIFDLSSEVDGSGTESEKGKRVEIGTAEIADDVKNLHDTSMSKAAELAAGFANALAGLAPNDIIQRTTGRLDTLHSEGVHRLSELCCFAVTQLVMLGKLNISNANKVTDQEVKEETVKIDWPEDSIERANVIRAKALSMTRCVEAVCSSFLTGISDVAEAYLAATKGASSDSNAISQKSIQEKANAYSENLRSNHSTAVAKIQDGLQYLTYVVVSTSMPAA